MLLGRDGRVLAHFTEAEREGRPLADLIEPAEGVGEDEVAAAALRDLSGWLVAGPLSLGRRLVARGARPVRHAYVMRVALDHRSLPAAPDGVRIGPFAHAAADLVPAWMAAYPPGHLDFRPGEDELPGALAAIESVVAAPGLWPLLPCSRVADDEASGRVVGAALVNDNPHRPPFGGPWLAELFREPGRRGLGGALLRSALHAAAQDGHATMELAVTDGNPAQGLYEALGFRVITSTMTVEVA